MKKTKIIALVLAISVMLLGAGYALWSDAVTLTSTVKTGKLDVQIDTDTIYIYDGYPEEYAPEGYRWTEAVVNNYSVDGIEITASKLYPGASFRLDFSIENKGDIPVFLKSVDVTLLDGHKKLYDKLTASGSVIYDTDGDNVDDGNSAFGWKQNSELQALTNLNYSLTSVLKDVVINPGGTIRFDPTDDGCIYFSLPADAGNDFMDLSCKFQIKFNFEQAPFNDALTEVAD